jgi:hypothetical protein
MFASRRLSDKMKQDVISITNNLFMSFVVYPWKSVFVHSSHIIFIESACGGNETK